jgi:hypothetical protein
VDHEDQPTTPVTKVQKYATKTSSKPSRNQEQSMQLKSTATNTGENQKKEPWKLVYL